MAQHKWRGAALLELDDRLAEKAARRERLTIVSKVTVAVLDVYCEKCRRSYAKAAGTECVLGPEHSGGPRKQPDPPTGAPPQVATGPW